MLMSPSSLLTRLDELKKWQQTQQERLMRQHKERLQEIESSCSETESLGILVLGHTERPVGESKNVDEMVLSPPKKFEVLLEEKLAQEAIQNVVDVNKPKKPFLRKGSGLARYQMNPGGSKKVCFKDSVHKAPPKPAKVTVKDSGKRNGIMKNVSPNLALKMPEVNVQPKAKWIRVDEPEIQETPTTHKEEIVNSFNKDVIAQINAFAAVKKNGGNGDVADSDQPDKDLLIFEALEKRALNSSFSSTNSSIMRMFESTPQKGSPMKGIDKHDMRASAPAVIVEEENEPSVNDSDIIEGLIRNHVQEGNIAELLLQLQLLQQRSTELYEFKQNEKIPDHVDISSASSVNSEDLQQCIEEAKFNDVNRWSTQSESDDNLQASSKASSVQGDETERTLIDVAVDTASLNNEDNEETDEPSDRTILAEKLQELNKEIDNFRAENREISKMRKELETERNNFSKERNKILKELEEQRTNMNIILEEEKRKLTKERMVFEKYVKDFKERPNKQERMEISSLKMELENLKEVQKMKDTKNSTTQARLRNQIKMLEKENARLKDEVEKLTKQNAKLTAAQRVPRRPHETKMLQEINKNLTKLTQETLSGEKNRKGGKKIIDDSDESSSSEAEERERKVVNRSGNNSKGRLSDGKGKKGASTQSKKQRHSRSSEEFASARSESHEGRNLNGSAKETQSCELLMNENDQNTINVEDIYGTTDIEKNYEQTFGLNLSDGKSFSNDSRKSLEKIETVLSDGTKEIRYSNGNLKIISPDSTVIKTNYYNGDIKETDLLRGQIRYFYRETDVWHTTYADGTEVIEFPNGQVERKNKEGVSEIKYPDGTVQINRTDGTQEVTYVDGTVVTITPEGEKILLLTNGQREIHTKEHMRREYPDGTIKLVYPDGSQETRYANGRIRLKDKDGKLLMDSFTS